MNAIYVILSVITIMIIVLTVLVILITNEIKILKNIIDNRINKLENLEKSIINIDKKTEIMYYDINMFKRALIEDGRNEENQVFIGVITKVDDEVNKKEQNKNLKSSKK